MIRNTVAVSAVAAVMAMAGSVNAQSGIPHPCPMDNKYTDMGTLPFHFSTKGDDPTKTGYVTGNYRDIRWNRPQGHKGAKHPHWDIGSGDYAPMHAWEHFNVKQSNQVGLTFTILNKPSNPRYIAMFVGGQEGIDGHPQLVTGTNAAWRQRISDDYGHDNWTDGAGTMDNRSPAQLFQDAVQSATGNAYGSSNSPFDWDETLVVVIADAAFMYPGILNGVESVVNGLGQVLSLGKNPMIKASNTMPENNAMLSAWAYWLNANVDWKEIKGFWGFGMSRGGCFVARFADLLFSTIPALNKNNAKLILDTIDPVCHPGEWRKEVQNSGDVKAFFQPPDRARDWLCHTVHIDQLFVGTPRKNIQWLNVITGQNIMEVNTPFVPLPTHCYADASTSTNHQNLLIDLSNQRHFDGFIPAKNDPFYKAGAGLPWEWGYGNYNYPMPQGCQYWYKQYWVPYGHLPIGGAHTQFNTWNPVINNPPGCKGTSYCGAATVTDLVTKIAPSGNPYTFLKTVNGRKCIPHPHNSLDWFWKGYKHATEAWATCLSTPIPGGEVFDPSNFDKQPLTSEEYFKPEVKPEVESDLAEVYGEVSSLFDAEEVVVIPMLNENSYIGGYSEAYGTSNSD